MGALRKAIMRKAKQQIITRGFLARELNRDRTTILKALNSLVRRGRLQKLRIQVKWPGDYVTSVNLYYTPESSGQLPALDQNSDSLLVNPDAVPALAEAYNRRKEAMTALEILRNRP